MKPESIVLAVAGIFFGVIVGWVIGSQQASMPRSQPAAQQSAAMPGATPGVMPGAQPPAQLDENHVQALLAAAQKNPSDAETRVQLANLYFDAERYQDAATWYEAALKISPKDANVSTDLGVSYYYMNQSDRALRQFDRSLSIDAAHAKTLLNQGIVRAFGKQDLQGAAASWRKLVEVAPNSQEATAARRALDGLKSAHPNLDAGAAGRAPGL